MLRVAVQEVSWREPQRWAARVFLKVWKAQEVEDWVSCLVLITMLVLELSFVSDIDSVTKAVVEIVRLPFKYMTLANSVPLHTTPHHFNLHYYRIYVYFKGYYPASEANTISFTIISVFALLSSYQARGDD